MTPDRTDDYDCNGGPWNSCHTVPAVSDFPGRKADAEIIYSILEKSFLPQCSGCL